MTKQDAQAAIDYFDEISASYARARAKHEAKPTPKTESSVLFLMVGYYEALDDAEIASYYV